MVAKKTTTGLGTKLSSYKPPVVRKSVTQKTSSKSGKVKTPVPVLPVTPLVATTGSYFQAPPETPRTGRTSGLTLQQILDQRQYFQAPPETTSTRASGPTLAQRLNQNQYFQAPPETTTGRTSGLTLAQRLNQRQYASPGGRQLSSSTAGGT